MQEQLRTILTAKAVDARCGLTAAQRWREEKAGRFPARIRITDWRVGYYSDEIDAWIANRPRGNTVIDTPRSPGRPRRVGGKATA